MAILIPAVGRRAEDTIKSMPPSSLFGQLRIPQNSDEAKIRANFHHDAISKAKDSTCINEVLKNPIALVPIVLAD